MQHHFVLKVIAKLLLPCILLFALYVQFHGDFGPGGGFQAGVIFAAGFILYGLVFGLENVRKVVPPVLVRTLIASGLLLYAGVGGRRYRAGWKLSGLRGIELGPGGRSAPGNHVD